MPRTITLIALMAATLGSPAIAQDAANVEGAAPTLAEIADSSDNLDIREGQGDAADSMVMLSDVLFPFGESTLRPAAIETLQNIAADLAAVGPFTLQGHTDDIGDDDYNIALAQRRASAVRDWLLTLGAIDAALISVIGVGEADPLTPNRSDDGSDLPEGRALNRRVEFVVN